MFGHNVKHRACDDLESFFWVLWVMSVNYTGPFNQTRDWEYIEQLMDLLAAEQSGTMVYHQEPWSKPATGCMPEIPKNILEDDMPGDASKWLAGISSRASTPAMTRLPAPPTPQPLPTSTSTPVSLDVSLKEQLHLGLQAQQGHAKKVRQNQLAVETVDKKTLFYHVDEFASADVPAWAKLGDHKMEYRQVAMDRVTLSWDLMKAFITPYFAVPPFLEGMEKLHSLFKGTTSAVKGVVVWAPPVKAPTHEDVIKILKEMLDGLTQELDPYPTVAQIQDGRERYESFLQDGRFPQFPQFSTAALSDVTMSTSGTSSGGTSSGGTSSGSGMNWNKHGVESLGLVEDGTRPRKMARIG